MLKASVISTSCYLSYEWFGYGRGAFCERSMDYYSAFRGHLLWRQLADLPA